MTTLIERTHYGRWPRPPMSKSERLEIWRRRWQTLTVEQTLGDRMARKVVQQSFAIPR